jgi:hypothetical protein
MLRTIAAAIVGVHGLIHVIGFVVPWRLADVPGLAYRTTAAAGQQAVIAFRVGHSGAHPNGAPRRPASDVVRAGSRTNGSRSFAEKGIQATT